MATKTKTKKTKEEITVTPIETQVEVIEETITETPVVETSITQVEVFNKDNQVVRVFSKIKNGEDFIKLAKGFATKFGFSLK